jgi:hypothetical protein
MPNVNSNQTWLPVLLDDSFDDGDPMLVLRIIGKIDDGRETDCARRA